MLGKLGEVMAEPVEHDLVDVAFDFVLDFLAESDRSGSVITRLRGGICERHNTVRSGNKPAHAGVSALAATVRPATECQVIAHNLDERRPPRRVFVDRGDLFIRSAEFSGQHLLRNFT